MGNVHTVNCVLASEDTNNNLPGLMKRTCQRMSFKRSGSSSSSSSEKSSSSSSNSSAGSTKIRKLGKKRLVLNTMPRCSSFENLSTALPSSKKTDNDPTYLLWKKAFEQRRVKPASEAQSKLAVMRRRVHNMSSAVSGHLTPKGFPAFIQKRLSAKSNKKPLPQLPKLSENPVKQPEQRKQRLALPQHLATKVTLSGATVSTVSASLKMKPTSSGHPSATASSVTKPKYTLAPLNLLSKLPQSKQAIIIEQLYRDIKELESRYDDQMESFIT